MPNQYLLPDDYANYGLPDTTTVQQVIQASLIIDTWLNKPLGLLYAEDANGEPAYMTKPNASYILTATNGIPSGSSITFAATGALQALSSGAAYGQTVLIDRATPSVTESCVIQSIDLINRTITLSNVQFNHAPGTLLEVGLSIFEECILPSDRAVTNISYSPVRNILGIQGQLVYPRRDESPAWPYGGSMIPYEFVNGINGEPILQTLNAGEVQFNEYSGQIYLPATLYSLYYNDVRVYYIAGWTYNSLPSDIKQACALIVSLATSSSINNNIAGPVTKYKAGGTEVDFANLANLSGSTAVMFYQNNTISTLLEPYRRTML